MFKKIKTYFYENLYSGEIEMILTTTPNTVWRYIWGYELSLGVAGSVNVLYDRRTYKEPFYKIMEDNRIIRNGRNVTKNVRAEFVALQREVLQNHIGKKYK